MVVSLSQNQNDLNYYHLVMVMCSSLDAFLPRQKAIDDLQRSSIAESLVIPVYAIRLNSHLNATAAII